MRIQKCPAPNKVKITIYDTQQKIIRHITKQEYSEEINQLIATDS